MDPEQFVRVLAQAKGESWAETRVAAMKKAANREKFISCAQLGDLLQVPTYTLLPPIESSVSTSEHSTEGYIQHKTPVPNRAKHSAMPLTLGD